MFCASGFASGTRRRTPGAGPATKRRFRFWRRLVYLDHPMFDRVWLVAVLSALPGVASAHHHSSAARVGESFTLDSFRAATSSEQAHWNQRLGYRLLDFSRTLHADGEHRTPPELGKVRLNLFTVNGQLTLPSATFIGVGVPFGHLSSRSPTEGSHAVWGLGDLEMSVGQVLLHRQAHLPLQLQLHATLTAPTGRYRPAAALSTSFASTAEDGSLALTTYDSRANLGAGSWSGAGSLTSSLWLGERSRIDLTTALAAPLNATSDGVRWGVDWLVRAASTVELIEDRLELVAGPDYRYHTPDRITDFTTDGVRVHGSRRSEVGILFGVAARLLSPLRCRVEGHLPLWQHATRTQLVETFSAGASCEISADL